MRRLFRGARRGAVGSSGLFSRPRPRVGGARTHTKHTATLRGRSCPRPVGCRPPAIAWWQGEPSGGLAPSQRGRRPAAGRRGRLLRCPRDASGRGRRARRRCGSGSRLGGRNPRFAPGAATHRRRRTQGERCGGARQGWACEHATEAVIVAYMYHAPDDTVYLIIVHVLILFYLVYIDIPRSITAAMGRQTDAPDADARNAL